MSIIAWVILGLLAGWIAGMIMGGGYGILGDIVVGIIGAVVGGLIFSALLGVDVTGLNVTSLIVAIVGAMLVIWLYRALFVRRRI